MKECMKCHAELVLGQFHKDRTRPDGRSNWCKSCVSQYVADYKDRNRERVQELATVRRRNLRLEVLSHYGNQCVCCKETRHEFLAIDHINGGGTMHRKQLRGVSIYKWLKKNHWPEGFQVLCHNCNSAKGYYGYCPHEKES